ncbi:MAG: tetratricopeptide repeat protein [Panacagrimonas sp.]
MRFHLTLSLAIVLLLSACTTQRGRREVPPPSAPIGVVIPAPTPVPAAPPVVPIAPPTPIEPAAPPVKEFPKTADAISSQAVISLMRQSNEARAQGQLDLAAAQLERAQRIEPRNYFVWSALAKVYLEQQQFDQAVSVASKSNSLGRGNVYVELENWKIIGAAKQAQGDSIGSLQAQSRIEEIERLLTPGL